MKRRPVARAAISSVVERATGEPLGCRHDREVIEEPLIDEFYELQARIATLGMELARTRGQGGRGGHRVGTGLPEDAHHARLRSAL
ncbi:hypothetical protein HSBAA_48240 [Vreelandella sulfidaeris]|uniref:Uncharacterized protein n=1 Tax=Vreelandella sulfidaeris TaxID=115553 RepID=A0A455UGS8_9GAMM|nr:hypothetical protein HSBAA_48240 [Halomonas sulfidaeris]